MLNPNEQTGKPAKLKSVKAKPVKVKSAKVVKPKQEPEEVFTGYPKRVNLSIEAFEALEKRLSRPGRYIPALAEALKRSYKRFPND